MKYLFLLIPFFSGCASVEPYVDTKLVWQHNIGSDWMLRPSRPWINTRNNPRLHVALGLEWKHQIDCPVISTGTDALRWVNLSCGKTFGSYKPKRTFNIFGEAHIIHQVDDLSSWWLRRERTDWMGHNPRLYLRAGLQWDHKIKCPIWASGTSIFQGWPYEHETGAPELDWTNFECSKRWGGW